MVYLCGLVLRGLLCLAHAQHMHDTPMHRHLRVSRNARTAIKKSRLRREWSMSKFSIHHAISTSRRRTAYEQRTSAESTVSTGSSRQGSQSSSKMQLCRNCNRVFDITMQGILDTHWFCTPHCHNRYALRFPYDLD